MQCSVTQGFEVIRGDLAQFKNTSPLPTFTLASYIVHPGVIKNSCEGCQCVTCCLRRRLAKSISNIQDAVTLIIIKHNVMCSKVRKGVRGAQ